MTNLYISTTGNDANDGLTIGSPKLTAQAAYDTAFADTGDYTLQLGAGTFAGITLTANWPVRIAVRGAGATSSFLGGISGNGADDTGSGATAGFNIEIVGDNTANLGTISTVGGYGVYISGNGGSVTLTTSTSGAISTAGSDSLGSSGSSGSSGSVSLTDSTSGDITTKGSDGYDGYGGYGGSVSLTTSTSGDIFANGGVGNYDIGNGDGGGGGGSVSLT
ncbi:MAG: hypothetical protein WCL11_28470, partial [Verrucomicrobiota bacterium]